MKELITNSFIFRRGLKLLTWNDSELTPKGPQRMRYDAFEDGCQVNETLNNFLIL